MPSTEKAAASTARASEGGRVVNPAGLRARRGIAVGDSLLWVEDEHGLRLVSPRAGPRRAQQIAGRCKCKGISEIGAFLRDKRAEAARE
jgi:bifunctional DNA-binding transcriptional regulator/antitoxin component of YhaV-PrlF toxin-antitoxin module